MDELNGIVEEIGRLNDSAESSKWQVAEHIAAAYSELPAYHRGLTAGLCVRLRKSSDTIYSMRNAEELRIRLKVQPVLSVSHFVTLSEAQARYSLADNVLIDWLDHARDCNMSVRNLREALTAAHVEDNKSAWMRKVRRVHKLVNDLLQDAEMVALPESLYQALKILVAMVGDFIGQLDKWKTPGD